MQRSAVSSSAAFSPALTQVDERQETTKFPPGIHVALLTGGGDKPYALGLASAVAIRGINLDFIGSDELVSAELLALPRVRFFNLRRDLNPKASIGRKV